MKNITLTLDDETAAWTRINAAQRSLSVSRFVSELLQSTMRESHVYEEAMHRFFSQQPVPLTSANGTDRPYPRREELYD